MPTCAYMNGTPFQTFTVKSVSGTRQWARKRATDSDWSWLRPGNTIDARKDSIRFVRPKRVLYEYALI